MNASLIDSILPILSVENVLRRWEDEQVQANLPQVADSRTVCDDHIFPGIRLLLVREADTGENLFTDE